MLPVNRKPKSTRKQRKAANSYILQSARVEHASHPQMIQIQSVRRFRVRTIASAAINGYQVLMTDIGALLGVIAKSATTSQFISSLTRLKSITLWGPVATAGTPVSVSLTWSNNSEDFESPPSTKTDTSISFDHPAFMGLKPPKNSLCSKWHSSGLTDSLFVFSVPAGATVDFEIDWVLCDGPNTPYVAGPTLIGATTGNIYHHPFSNLVPLGLNVL